jgi:hypothetical protein
MSYAARLDSGVTAVDCYVYTLVDSSFESDAESVECGFASHDPFGPSFAGGVKCPEGEVDTFECCLFVGKWPLARTARLIRALRLSIALVEYTIRRISGSNWRNGTNSAHALLGPSRDGRNVP